MADKAPVISTPGQKKAEASAANFLAIAILVTLIVVVISGVLLKGRWSAYQLNSKVSKADTTTLDNLKANLSSYDNLQQTYQMLTADGRARLTLDSLPVKPDITSLATALSNEASQAGVNLQSVAMVDSNGTSISSTTGTAVAASTAPAAPSSGPVPMNVSVSFSGAYASVIQFLKTLEQSSRPIRATNVTIGGGDGGKATVTLTLVTYYEPPVKPQPTTEVIK